MGAGCDTRAATPDLEDRYSVEDSAGIRITTVTLEYSNLPEWHLSAEPRMVLDGSGAGDGPFFERITSAAWTSDGGVIVLDRQADRLHLFSPQGSYLRSFGQSGNGPGEFGNIAVLSVTVDDSVFVFDRAHDRVTIFHPGTGFVRDLSIRATTDVHPLDVWALAPDRFLLHALLPDLSWMDGYDGRPLVTRTDGRLTVHDGSGAVRSGTVVFPASRSAQFAWGEGGLPLWPKAHVAAGPAGVVYGTGGPTLTVLDPDLRVRASIRWPGLLEPVTEADRESVRTNLREVFGQVMPDRVGEIIEISLSDEAVSVTRPAHGALVLGTDGSVWVSRYEPVESPERWHVFDPEGRPAGRIRLPPRSRLLAADGQNVLIVEHDSLDVPSVMVYEIERGSGS